MSDTSTRRGLAYRQAQGAGTLASAQTALPQLKRGDMAPVEVPVSVYADDPAALALLPRAVLLRVVMRLLEHIRGLEKWKR